MLAWKVPGNDNRVPCQRGCESVQAEQSIDQLQAELAQAKAELRALREEVNRQDLVSAGRQAEALRAFAANVYAARGDAFFTLLASTLAEALGVDYVAISRRCDDDPRVLRSLAFVADGEVVDNFVVGLAGTPCERVLLNEVCAFPERAQSLFPDDQLLIDLRIEGYVGVPLVDAEGELVGAIAAADRRPIDDVPHVVSFLQLVARPVQAELDRRRAEAALTSYAAELELAYARLHERNTVNELEIEMRTRELAKEKAQSEVMIAHLPVVMVFMDPDLIIRWASPLVYPLLGVAPEDILHRSVGEISPQTVGVGSRVHAALMSKQPFEVRALPLPYSGEGAETGYWDVIYIPTLDEQGCVMGIMVMANEVTSQVENQRLQAERIEQLEELDRLKRDFVNTVSHELRTPLTSIMGFAEFLEDEIGGPLTPVQAEYVGQIQRGAVCLRRIVDDLLDFSRLEAGTLTLRREPVELVGLFHQAVDSLRPQAAEAGVSLEADWPGAETVLTLDGRRIAQVIVNLVSNAIKFTRRGGSVKVSATIEADRVEIAVSDTGIGVAAEHLPLVFDKFFQVDPSTTREQGGAGLGLSIAKAFVEAHGGEIGVESVLGEGSTFWIRLPGGD